MTLKIDNKLQLRQMQKSDAADIFALIDSQREYLGKWLPFVEFTKEVGDTEKFVESVINAPEDQFEYVFTIRYEGACVGIAGFKTTDKLNRKTEIGYWLSESFQKKGIVTRSVKALCNFAFSEQNINRIQIKCAVENTPSINIPKRLGFKLEGIERQGELLAGGIFTDLEVYSILKSEWK